MRLLDRRTLLTGLGLGAGSHLLGPMVRSLVPEALGQTSKKTRLVVYINSMSVPKEYLPQPGATDTAFTLGQSWAPLEKHRSEMLFLNRLINPFNKDLHGNRWPLSIAPEGPGRAPGGITFDRQIGAALTTTEPFPSLSLLPTAYHTDVGHSADGKGRVFPGEKNPIKAYQRIFGGDVTSGLSPEQRLARKQSVLDFVRGDITRLQTRLAGPEKERLDQYLESVRGTERQLTSLVTLTASCTRPGAIDPSLSKTDGDVRSEMFQAHLDIAASALTCGLTRVVTLQMGGDFFESGHYAFLGEDRLIGAHGQWHGDPNKNKHYKLYGYHAGNVAAMRDRLATVREGGATAADNTLFMMMNSGGAQHHDGWNTHWMLLLGSLGGQLKTGRYIDYAAQRSVSDAFVSAANALGVNVSTVGDPSACKGALPGLT